MVIGIAIITYVVVLGMKSSQTTIRLIANQWSTNKRLKYLSDEEIYYLILRQRYRVKTLKELPDNHKGVIQKINNEIVSGLTFYRNYSLPLTLYTIFLIENNKEYINPETYSSEEDIFKAISNDIKNTFKVDKYFEY